MSANATMMQIITQMNRPMHPKHPFMPCPKKLHTAPRSCMPHPNRPRTTNDARTTKITNNIIVIVLRS